VNSRIIVISTIAIILTTLAAACGGDGTGNATPTPAEPGPVDAISDWVHANRNVDFIGECSNAQQGVDVGKICVTQAGSRGTRRAYYMGPAFSEGTALAIVEKGEGSWKILSVTNNNPGGESIPGIPWPLQVGDSVIVIGLGDECLRVREQPTTAANAVNCMPDGTTALVQEGPVEAETFTWWRVAGDGFNGWAAGTWLRLPEAIAQALNPPTGTPTPTS
jgi:hypothetical protein